MLDKVRKINPLPNGNCLYNAKALAFCDLVLLGKLDDAAKKGRYDLLLSELKKINPVLTDWEAFKKYLNENKNKPATIQRDLASAFRKIVADLKEQEFKSTGHKNESEIDVFLAEFRDYVYDEYSLPRDEGNFMGGDIYCKIPKLVQKFRETTQKINDAAEGIDKLQLVLAYMAYNSTQQELSKEQTDIHDEFEGYIKEQYQDLKKWFLDIGYQIYLDFIRTPGEWVGDLELATLSAHLGINTKAQHSRKRKSIDIYNPHGHLPTNFLNPDQIDLLRERGIINKKPDMQDLEIQEQLDKEKLIRRLEDIKNIKIVSDYWFDNQRAEKILVPSEWVPNKDNLQSKMEANNLFDEEDFAELIQRGIIRLDQDTGRYVFFQLSGEEFIKKINGVENSKFIIEQLFKYYENPPDVYLSNPNAVHWYYLQPREYTHWDLTELEVNDAKKLISEKDLYDSLTTVLKTLGETYDSKKNKSNGITELDEGIDNNNDDDYDMDESEDLFEDEDEDEEDELENELELEEDTQHEEEENDAFMPGKVEQESELDKLKNILRCITQTQAPRSQSPENGYSPSETSGFSFMSSDLSRDSALKLTLNTTLPDKRKRVQSTSSSPLNSSSFWSRKLNTPTAAPPQKRLLEEPQSQMQKLAEEARDSLTKIQSINQETKTTIKELTDIFNNIIKENQIPEINSLQLLTPQLFLPEVTKEILEFRSKHLNQILSKAYALLHTKVMYLFTEIANKGDIEDSPTIALLNDIFTAFGQSTSFNKELQETIKNFDLSKVDNIPPAFKELVKQIKNFIEHCKHVIENTDSRACAKSILSMSVIMNNEYSLIKKNFLEASKFDIDSLDSNTLSQILSINPKKNIKNDELASAVKGFIELYQQEILDALKRVLNPSL